MIYGRDEEGNIVSQTLPDECYRRLQELSSDELDGLLDPTKRWQLYTPINRPTFWWKPLVKKPNGVK